MLKRQLGQLRVALLAQVVLEWAGRQGGGVDAQPQAGLRALVGARLSMVGNVRERGGHGKSRACPAVACLALPPMARRSGGRHEPATRVTLAGSSAQCSRRAGQRTSCLHPAPAVAHLHRARARGHAGRGRDARLAGAVGNVQDGHLGARAGCCCIAHALQVAEPGVQRARAGVGAEQRRRPWGAARVAAARAVARRGACTGSWEDYRRQLGASRSAAASRRETCSPQTYVRLAWLDAAPISRQLRPCGGAG